MSSARNSVVPIERVILHAGLPKTATTTIQECLFSKRDLLLSEAEVLYPGSEANHTNQICTAFLDNPERHITNRISGNMSPAELREFGSSIREKLREEIVRISPKVVLLSAEGVSNLKEGELSRLKEWVGSFCQKLEVHYFVRSPLKYTTSVILQHLKGGETLEELFEQPPLPNFKGRLQNAINAFGRSCVSVHKFEDAVAHQDGVVGFFVDAIDLQVPKGRARLVADQRHDNQALSYEAAKLLSSINRQRPAFTMGKRGPRRSFTEVTVLEKISGSRFRLPKEVQDRVIAESASDVSWLKKEFDVSLDVAFDEDSENRQAAEQAENFFDSASMTLSNLINYRYVQSLYSRANSIRQQGNEVELAGVAREIIRVSPAEDLPSFLRDALGRFR